MNSIWTRRDWLARNVVHMGALLTLSPRLPAGIPRTAAGCARRSGGVDCAGRVADQAARLEPGPWQALALQAVDAATAAGASYADARLTRTVVHRYNVDYLGRFFWDEEKVGVGVRVLVHGYWGFAASPLMDPDEVVRLARAAVAQGIENAKGPPREVALGSVPVVTGTWATPITIDPFTVTIEEKRDNMSYWAARAAEGGLPIYAPASGIGFARQERVVATSAGALFTQTIFESGGGITSVPSPEGVSVAVHGIGVAGKGWELFTKDAKVGEQVARWREQFRLKQEEGMEAKYITVGRYTVVVDGATMANLLDSTLGIATQLDRALGYEANAGGTSFIDDPLAMVGHLQVASPLVTVTANRSAPAELATVQWDDEGIVPPEVTLVKDGVLTDFQTTREQAAWLAPYYHAQGRPVRSNGCAAAEDGLNITMQMVPNLALEPSASPIRLEDLVADVKDGILIEGGGVQDTDSQGRNGLLRGPKRKITNGRLGAALSGGAVLFNTLDLYKKITAVGGASTQGNFATSAYLDYARLKGEPGQGTSHSVRAVAAVIANQPMIDPNRKA